MAKKIKVLLLKPLPPKWNAGEVIEVKIHFAQHVLIPQGIAVVYDKQVENQRAAQMKKVATFKADLLTRVKDMLSKVENDGITFTKQVTDNGWLYDSISSKTIAQYITHEFAIKLGTDSFTLEPKIETVGDYEVGFSYEGVSWIIPVHVVAETA